MRRALGACAALLLWHAVAIARAQEASTYEISRVDRALSDNRLERDPLPTGKRIAFVRVVREEVFVDGELLAPIVLPRAAPTWPNTFHWVSEESTVRAELLCKEGDVYDGERIDESMRNLRALGIFALVRIEAVRAANADEVGLLVFTRDLWSLRLETGFSGVGDAFSVTAQLTERNLFGRNKQLSLRWDRDPKAWSLGELYYDRRVAGQALALTQSFDVIFNQESGDTEGSQGSLYFGRPFYDLSQRVSWGLTASYAVFVARRLRGNEIIAVRPTPEGLVACDPGEPSCYLQTWDDQQVATTASVSYRIGERYKQTFSVELGFSDRDVEPNDETLVEAGSRAEVENELLPRVRTQVYPRIGYSMWVPRYKVLENLSTFGQSENVRVGPELSAAISMPLSAFGSSSDSVLFSAGSGYVWSEHDALAEATLSVGTRLEDGRARDQRAGLLLRGATPSWALGRFVGVASYSGHRRDSARSLVSIGGDSGLRGYGAGELFVFGGNKVYANVEYRSLPLVVQSVHFGGVVFYDAGGVYASIDRLAMKHSVGAGLRVLFPQFNRYPLRADLGIPLGEEGFAVRLSWGSDQAIALTATDDAQGSAVR